MSRQFLKLAAGVPTLPTMTELHRQPELWNDYAVRKTFAGSPHAGMDDVWLRGPPRCSLNGAESHKTIHIPEFWPAWQALPSVRPLVFGLMAQMQAVQLGGILITRLPPSAAILPRVDADSWHATFFNAKVHLTLSGVSLSRCGDDAVTMITGDVWTFNNQTEHSVENAGDADRIVLIVAMRCEP